MKNVFMTAILLGSVSLATAQTSANSGVPAPVSQAFSKACPKATDIEWEQHAFSYEVEFEIDRLDYEVSYAADGSVVASEQELRESELPAGIQNQLKQNYSGFRFDEAKKYIKDGKTRYMVEVENTFGKEHELFFDDQNALLNAPKGSRP